MSSKSPKKRFWVKSQTTAENLLTLVVTNSLNTIKFLASPYNSSPPQFVKWRVLKKYSRRGVFIETGTHRGLTTFYLSKFSNFVISIEPSRIFYDKSANFLSKRKNVKLLFGTSEDRLNESIEIAREMKSNSINFWLDGHYSSGLTFKGGNITPILSELEIIKGHLEFINDTVILIDDVRLFRNCDTTGYPCITAITSWAQLNGFSYSVHSDIAVLTRIYNV